MKRTHDCRGPEWLYKLSVAIATAVDGDTVIVYGEDERSMLERKRPGLAVVVRVPDSLAGGALG